MKKTTTWWIYGVIMPFVSLFIIELLPINNLDIFPRLIIGFSVGLIVSMIIFFIRKKYLT
ncbi:hypothetical protein [Alkalibacterium sp. 20]|uniref:hypothetical protein n=1 Tax=Alkalibacterium sp. 20 TaxID=1798803 RepID=UPI00090038B0|nr:hypothetical protein [Alkalibacterium sp. 20]OJF91677.1 hypothetical protein AX762_10860 [Alkalibacterium sp. 20]